MSDSNKLKNYLILPITNIIRLPIIGLNIIKKQGFRVFLGRFKDWLFKKPLDASQIPLVDIPITSGSQYHVEKSLTGSFIFPADNLFEIRLYTVDKGDDSKATLLIKDDEGRLLREVSLDNESIKVNGFTSFKFEPIPDSRGRAFKFKLIVRDGKVGVSYNKLYRSERLELSYDDMPVRGAIGFQAFGKVVAKTLYDVWTLKNEPVASELERYKKAAESFAYRPRVSIITPVYNPEVAWIKAAVDSVLAQVYDNWELCLADASTKAGVKECLREYSNKDPRIKVKFLDKNGGIAANSNEALSLATGEYVAFLDHDDELSPDALYEVAGLLQEHPDADMVYSDEDKISEKGVRSDPFFKPDWSQDMFLSCMYTCHLSVYRKSIVDQAKGFREGYDGSQDYDLALRVIEKTSNIRHIPKILYHWRTVSGSAAGSVDSKTYAYDAAKRALKDYIVRNNIKGEVIDGLWRGSYYIKRELGETPLVSIIIPVRDHAKVLKNCVDSIVKNTRYPNYELIIVNNNSKEKDTLEYFKEIQKLGNVHVLDYNEDFNFSAINNFAVKHAGGEVLLFLNNDMKVITDTWMTSMLEQAQRGEVGAVGCKLLYPDNTIQHAGIILGVNGRDDVNNVAANCPYRTNGLHHGYFGRENIILDLSAVTAACMMIRRKVFDEVGGFDENLAVAYNDVDLCIRLRLKGYLILYMPYAVMYHYESLSRGYEDTKGKQERFDKEVRYIRNKWANVIDAGDPYYNPNLSLHHGDYRVKI
jgi:GT2 family glycosyltransferase